MLEQRRNALAFLGVGIAAGFAGWVLSTRVPDPTGETSDLRSASFVDLHGNPRSLSEWEGRVCVINFWATWCPPCREEIPAFVLSRNKLHASGVEFIGIAIDQAAKVTEFVRSVQISYPVLLAGATALDLVRTLGNPSGGLPFTVILDRKGALTHRNLGAVTGQKIEEQVLQALAT